MIISKHNINYYAFYMDYYYAFYMDYYYVACFGNSVFGWKWIDLTDNVKVNV